MGPVGLPRVPPNVPPRPPPRPPLPPRSCAEAGAENASVAAASAVAERKIRCVIVLLLKRGPEGADLGRERWWFRFSSKKARGESAPAAVAANQAVAIDFVAAPLAQVARLENERGNGRADTRHRGRGLRSEEHKSALQLLMQLAS